MGISAHIIEWKLIVYTLVMINNPRLIVMARPFHTLNLFSSYLLPGARRKFTRVSVLLTVDFFKQNS